jgi:PEP-CTERM motif
MKIRQVLAFAALVIGMGTASVAKADPICTAGNPVATGFGCSLGDLTFTFDVVSFLPPGSTLGLEPPTGISGGVATLAFQLLQTANPVDVHLVYEVTSTSADILGINNSFTFLTGGQIMETACSVNPELTNGSCPTADILGSILNTTGGTESDTFTSPVSTMWIDKDVTDTGFSSFSDSVEEVTPEPSSIALFGTGLLAAAGALRRRLVK